MAEREQLCETCRFWKTWDEAEPVKITKREFWFRQFKDMYSTEQIEAIMQQLPDDMESLIFNSECTGDCRVHAPEIAVNRAADDDSDPCIGRWPFTSVDDWCGEWQPIPSADAASVTDKQLAIAWGLRDKFPERTIDNLGRVIAKIRQLIEEGYSSEADLKRRVNARKNSKRLALVSEIRARLLREWQPAES